MPSWPCKRLRSDQGSNFVGLLNQESSCRQSDLTSEIENQGCSWELTPPKASHFGGDWERQIQSIKNILDCCLHQLGTRILSRDEFYTFLQEGSCILNNTPLWEHSANPNDPRPLTPGMLLNLRGKLPNVSIETCSKDILAYGSKRWRRVQYLSDQFWSRWRTDYLQTLQKRRKWLRVRRSFVPGDIVLLRDNNCKRYQWPMAKILSVKKSTDSVVRSVEIITSARNSGGMRKLWRPITELSLLVS